MKTLPLRRAKNPTRKMLRKQERTAKKQGKGWPVETAQHKKHAPKVRKQHKETAVDLELPGNEGEFALDPESFDYLDDEIHKLEKKLGLRSKEGGKAAEIEKNWTKMRKYLDLDGLGADFYDKLDGKATKSPEPDESAPQSMEIDEAELASSPENPDEIDSNSASEHSAPSEPDEPPCSEPLKRLKPIETGTVLKQVTSILNRLSEQNVDPLTSQLAALYGQHSMSEVNEALTNTLVTLCVKQANVPLYILTANVAAVAALSALIGKEVSAYVLKSVYELYKSPDSTRDVRKHSVLLLSYLYLFGALSGLLICGLVTELSTNMDEVTIELIIDVLNVVGFRLRKDEPEQLKTLIVELQTRAKAYQSQCKRTDFMLEVIANIKNNKKKLTKDDRLLFLKTWLKTTIRAKARTKEFILKATWEDLSSKRWRELVTVSTVEMTQKTAQRMVVDPRLEEIAREQHMNTETRRVVFYTVMGASDYKDAFCRLEGMGNRGVEKEVMRVLIACCGQETTYNPYYSLLAEEYLHNHKKLKYSFQFSLWDFLKQIEEFTARKVANLAKFTSRLIWKQVVDFSSLKIIELEKMGVNLSLFFRVLMEEILKK